MHNAPLVRGVARRKALQTKPLEARYSESSMRWFLLATGEGALMLRHFGAERRTFGAQLAFRIGLAHCGVQDRA